MGLFNWFREPSTLQTLDDVVWLTKAAKYQGIAQEVKSAREGAQPPACLLIVTHFSDCYDELAARLDEQLFASGKVALAMAGELPAPSALASVLPDDVVQLIVAQRHFLRERDDAILTQARAYPCRSRVVFHTSLDDTLMRVFAGDQTRQLLIRLGMKEDEPIRSKMVTRRLVTAQQKVAKTVRGDLPASSDDEWWQKNVGG